MGLFGPTIKFKGKKAAREALLKDTTKRNAIDGLVVVFRKHAKAHKYDIPARKVLVSIVPEGGGYSVLVMFNGHKPSGVELKSHFVCDASMHTITSEHTPQPPAR